MMRHDMANLQDAIEELRQLPEDLQTEIVTRLEDMVARAKIDAKLAESEKRGGATPSDTFFAELRAENGG